jgi:hypothetical protein
MKFSALYADVWKGKGQLGKKKWWVFVSLIKNLIPVFKPGRLVTN